MEVYTEIRLALHALSLKVKPSGLLHSQTLKSSIYLLCFYFLNISEINFLTKMAQPYSVSSPSYLPQIPNQFNV